MNIYQTLVFTDKLVSPINGYTCRRITKQNIKQFGFDSIDQLHSQYPDFPLRCNDCIHVMKTNLKASASKISKSLSLRCERIKQQEKSEYELNVKHCKACDRILSFEKRFNTYCNRSCGNKHRAQTTETRLKISKSLTKNKEPIIKSPVDNSLVGIFKRSQMYRIKSQNLINLGFSFTQPIEQEFIKIQNLLYTEYYDNKESMLSIMKKYNIPSSRTMDILFRLFDVESRSLSEGSLVALEYDRKNVANRPFLTIYHKSWHGDIVILRSTYEETYAKILDSEKIMYFVESLRIKYFSSVENRYRIAIPDFYLPAINTIVEVKATYWLDEANMRDKKKAYLDKGYNFALNLDNQLLSDW